MYFIIRMKNKPKYFMYGRDSCPHCVNMKKQLSSDGVLHDFRFVDVTSRYGKKMFSLVNADGVPFFINPVNNATASGSMPTSELYNKLHSDNQHLERINIDLDLTGVIMFGSHNCGYTTKMIDEIKAADAWSYFTFIDVDTKKGRALYSRTQSETGVPYIVHPNGNTVVGYVPFKELIKKLAE